MTNQREADTVLQILRSQQAAYRRLAETNRLEGQAAQDPYLMGKACAFLEAADVLRATILTVEASRGPRPKVRLEIVS